MDMIETLGLVAALLTTLAFMPQAIKTIKTRNTDDLSISMYILFFCGVALWLVYGIYKDDLPIVIANGVTLISAGVILYIMLTNDKTSSTQKIEHLGIAVADIDEGEALYEKLLGVKPYKREEVKSQGVITSFFKQGPNKIELVAPLVQGEGPIGKYLEKKGPGIHHVAYAVKDIEAEMSRLRAEGCRLLQEKPVHGADNKLVCFVHPKSAGGVLMELCQERTDS